MTIIVTSSLAQRDWVCVFKQFNTSFEMEEGTTMFLFISPSAHFQNLLCPLFLSASRYACQWYDKLVIYEKTVLFLTWKSIIPVSVNVTVHVLYVHLPALSPLFLGNSSSMHCLCLQQLLHVMEFFFFFLICFRIKHANVTFNIKTNWKKKNNLVLGCRPKFTLKIIVWVQQLRCLNHLSWLNMEEQRPYSEFAWMSELLSLCVSNTLQRKLL